jgi:hypothetical protein
MLAGASSIHSSTSWAALARSSRSPTMGQLYMSSTVEGSSALKSCDWRTVAGATSRTTIATATASMRPTAAAATPRLSSHFACTTVTTGASATPTSAPTPMPVTMSDATETTENSATAANAVATRTTYVRGSMSTMMRRGALGSVPGSATAVTVRGGATRRRPRPCG